VTSIAELQTSDGSTRPITSQTWLRVNGLAWLPDGSGLLMLATAGQSFFNQVWLLAYPSGEARRLTNDLNNYQSMSLSADANTLSLVKSEQQASIWIAPIDDLDRARAVTSGSGKSDVVTDWANDGRIFYHSNASGIDDIWVVGA